MKPWAWIAIAVIALVVGVWLGVEFGALFGGAAGVAGTAVSRRISGRRATEEPPEFDDSNLIEVIADEAKDPEHVATDNPFDAIISDGRAVPERE